MTNCNWIAKFTVSFNICFPEKLWQKRLVKTCNLQVILFLKSSQWNKLLFEYHVPVLSTVPSLANMGIIFIWMFNTFERYIPNLFGFVFRFFSPGAMYALTSATPKTMTQFQKTRFVDLKLVSFVYENNDIANFWRTIPWKWHSDVFWLREFET